MKKTLSLILALLMSLSCASAIFAADDDAAVADEAEVVAEAADEEAADAEEEAEEATPYDDAIEYLNYINVLKGRDDGKLYANADVKRYEAALLFGRVATGWVDDSTWGKIEANDLNYTDLEGSGAINVVGALAYVDQKGIVEGYPDGSFKPENNVTYREALTMAVRTLGYKGLEYPWGYIQTAVELGLTENIEGIAYTDVITRGVAAQIIYNTLFAEGAKLSVASFGRSFGWANVVITASVAANAEVLKLNYNDANLTPKQGWVAFQMVNDDKTLDKTVYYLDAKADLGLDYDWDSLEGRHVEDAILGKPYRMFFESDEGGIATLIKAVPVEPVATATNAGRTDNEGKGLNDEVSALLKKYVLVDKFSGTGHIASTNRFTYDKQLVVYTSELKGLDNPYKVTYRYAFDWNTGDILELQADGTYAVKYYYDYAYDYYFEIQTNGVDKDGNTILVGIKVVDKAAALGLVTNQTAASYNGYVMLQHGSKIKTDVNAALYSTLDLYDINNDGAADYGFYEAYTFGRPTQMKENDDNGIICWKEVVVSWNPDDGKEPVIKDLFTGASLYWAERTTDNHDGVWWTAETAKMMPNGELDGSTYYIYTINYMTLELKIMKTIEKWSKDLVDADTYYKTGVLKGYKLSGSKPYVKVGDETLELNGDFGIFAAYIDRNSDRFKDGSWKAVEADKLAKLFNEYVTYYVLDGKLVDIQPCKTGAEADYIVVDSLAGLSSDGYITVWGWNTKNCEYKMYRVAVYDGWYTGDFYWNPNAITNEFDKCAIYEVTSYDADVDAYYVKTVGTKNADGTYTLAIGGAIDFTFQSGYRISGGNEAGAVKTSANDRYIIIGQAPNANAYTPIAYYEGRVTEDGWALKGTAVQSGNTWIVYNCTNVVGFNWEALTTDQLVLTLGKSALDMSYNGSMIDDDAWYLKGATEYEQVAVYNFFTGDVKYLLNATNKKTSAGKIYRAVAGRLYDYVGDATTTWATIWKDMNDTFTSFRDHNANGTKFTLKNIAWNDAYIANNDNGKNTFSREEASAMLGLNLKVNGLCTSVLAKIYANGTVRDMTAADIQAAKDAAVAAVADDQVIDATVVTVDAVITMGDKLAVVLYNPTATCVTHTKPVDPPAPDTVQPVKVTTSNAIQKSDDQDAAIVGTVTGNTVVVDGQTTGDIEVKTLNLSFIGSGVSKENHAAIYNAPYYFDVLNYDDYLAWDAKFWDSKTDAAVKIYGKAIAAQTYADCTKDSTDHAQVNGECALIQGFTVTLPTTLTVAKDETVKVAFSAIYCQYSLGQTARQVVDIELTNTNGTLTAKFVASDTANGNVALGDTFIATTSVK